MKYIKILGLLAVAAAALMAFAGSASADKVTSSTGETPTIKATSTNSALHNVSLGFTTSCSHSVVEGTVTSHGPGKPVVGHISTLTFAGCNNHVNVLKKGTLSIVDVAPTGNGTLTSTGAEVEVVNTALGIICIYSTNSTHIGTLTGGTHAVLDIGSSVIPRTGGSPFCGSQGQWTGNYTVNSHPTDLTVHNS